MGYLHDHRWRDVTPAQPTLFPLADPFPPLDEIRLIRQRLLVFETLCDMQRRDPRGANAFELQAWLIARGSDHGIQRNAVSSRFNELESIDYGFVECVGERTAPTGKGEKVYAPTARGLEWRRLQAEAA